MVRMRFQMPNWGANVARKPVTPSAVIAFDLGVSSLKYVRLQKKSGLYALTHFGVKRVIEGADGSDSVNAEQLGQAVRACAEEMGIKRGHAVASLSARSTLVRQVEFPQMPLEDMKKALKINSAPYLHQQYSNFNFDCHIIPPRAVKNTDASKAPAKIQVLVGGASTPDVLLCRDALTSAGFSPLAINLAPIALVNAYEASNKNVLETETVALVDIGYENSVVNILDKGRPVLTRSIPFGGHHLTTHIAKTLSLDVRAAEEEKMKMSEAVQVFVGACLSGFAQQVRSSIDFFERQYEIPVKRVCCSGGTALSTTIMQFLSDEIGLPCKSWDPTENLPVDLKKKSVEDLKAHGANLPVAIGTAQAVVQ